MPEIRHYTVTQTQEIKVEANLPGDAAQIAAAWFADTKKPDVWGQVTSPIRTVRLLVDEDR